MPIANQVMCGSTELASAAAKPTLMMELQTLEGQSAAANELARRLDRKAEEASEVLKSARIRARQAKVRLKQSKQEAKLARHAVKLARRAVAELQETFETATIKAAIIQKKLQKTRQKTTKSLGGNGKLVLPASMVTKFAPTVPPNRISAKTVQMT